MKPQFKLVLVVLLSVTLVVGCGQSNVEPGAGETSSIAITNVTVINVITGALASGMTVLTSGDQIVAMGEDIAIADDIQTVDGTGKFLIPGLWDMHAHHQGSGVESLDLFLANGVTGTRDMGADLDFIMPLQEQINQGALRGPEIITAGPILDAAPPEWPYRQRVTTAEEARAAVRELNSQNVAFIKVHDQTPREAFFAIAEEARELELSFAGHVPVTVSMAEAAESGMQSIEHLANYRVFLECSGNAPYSPDSCRELFSTLAANDVWQVPTIAFFQYVPDMFSGEALPHAAFASASLLQLTRENVEASNVPPEAIAFLRSMASTSLTVIHDMHRQGNRMLAGCDGLVPGFCLHDELEWFVAAGLSPLEALQTATINPARFLNREESQGSIEVGKRADLVLLDANPLEDINNVRLVSAVVTRGVLLSATAIAEILL